MGQWPLLLAGGLGFTNSFLWSGTTRGRCASQTAEVVGEEFLNSHNTRGVPPDDFFTLQMSQVVPFGRVPDSRYFRSQEY